LLCHVNGGKPVPRITFYRLLHTNPQGGESVQDIQYFNSTNKQRKPLTERNITRIQLVVEQADHETKFGCSATSVVISGRLLSEPKEVKVLFPPGPPILTAIPHGAVSENRTRVFVCRASRGSYPVAQIRWKLQPAMDYASSLVSKRPTMRPFHQISNTTSSRTDVITDFDVDEEELKLSDRPQLKDPTNRGVVAMSEARLTSRPWFNGARVSCHLDWSYDNLIGSGLKIESTKQVHRDRESEVTNETAYHRPASLTTEVLFPPSAISLSVSPLNGIQEHSGEQVLECTSTSSFPAAKITWLKRAKFSKWKDDQMANRDTDVSSYVTPGWPLETFDTDVPVTDNVVSEVLPGLYGGKRVVSHLTLVNLTRSDDGTIYICKVTHIEWIRSYARYYALVVLYPPQLSIRVWPETWQDRLALTKTTLQCIPTGGRPLLTNDPGEVSEPQNGSYYARKTNDIWKFTWLFRPTYPDNLWSHGQARPLTTLAGFSEVAQNASKILNHHNKSEVILHQPGRQLAGEYTCLLEGPGGAVRSSVEMKFAFPPELVPSGQTAFTSPIGSSAVLELFIWAYPCPLPLSTMYESYSTPMRVKPCGDKVELDRNVNGVAHSWFKVRPDGKSSTRLDRERDPIDGSQSNTWSDVILVNLASIFTQQIHAFSPDRSGSTKSKKNSNGITTHSPIPTLVYRLVFDHVQESDYGEYICEIEHWVGKRTFLVRLQPPVDSSVSMKDVQFSRAGSIVKLKFDPAIMRPGDFLISEHSKNIVTSVAPIGTSAKRDTESKQVQNQTNFVWMLIRICVLVEQYRSVINTTGVDSSSCSDSTNTDINQIQPTLCVNRIVENPERGSATIQLDVTDYKTAQEAAGWPVATEVDYPFPGGSNRTRPFVSDPQSLPIRWDRVRRVAYQLRFYDDQGRLAHHTNWVYENSNTPLSTSTPIPVVKMGLILPAAVILTFLIVLLLSVIPLFVIFRNRKRKQDDGLSVTNLEFDPIPSPIVRASGKRASCYNVADSDKNKQLLRAARRSHSGPLTSSVALTHDSRSTPDESE
uniref:Ig-like domain-containing protein n=1 Tax=Echinostoma caproni TaxID=27848 RepID=A0A183AFI9_9TREM